MKRLARVLLSTISTAAMTAVFGLPAAGEQAVRQRRPAAERAAFVDPRGLSFGAGGTSSPSPGSKNGDQVAQFRNFPNFPNFSNWRNR